MFHHINILISPIIALTVLTFLQTVRDTAQENVKNTHEETRLFLVVVNQPKKITAIRTR